MFPVWQKGIIRIAEHHTYIGSMFNAGIKISIVADIYRTRIRDILGVFKLSGDDIEKKVAVLSGGEKARVSLAKILLSPVNFLLMDEPTNHLDLHSKEALESALLNFDGTLLLISHDRYFLDKLVSVVYELKNGQLKRFEGNYSDYLRKRNEKRIIAVDNIVNTRPKSKKQKERKRIEAEARQKISEKRNQLRIEIEALEVEIEKIEIEKSQLEVKMVDPEFYKDPEKSAKCTKRYQNLQIDIPNLISEWETKQTEFEKLLSEINSKDG